MQQVKPGNAVIIGAGIAGLAAAMALARHGWRVRVIERDPQIPEGGADTAFCKWRRRGVPQMRHSHVFLARLTNLLRDHYPALLEDMLGAGCRILDFRDSLPESLLLNYVPEPGDADLSFISSRRVTLEIVMRRHVGAIANVEILAGHKIRGLMTEQGSTPPRVKGVEIEADGQRWKMPADIVIDASGRGSHAPSWLHSMGVRIEEESSPAGIVYFTRHYRFRGGNQEPQRGKYPAAGELDYLKYGVFRADNGWFSLTLAVPEIEEGLRKAACDAEVFENICRLLPGVAPWRATGLAEPMSDVSVMGGLRNIWRHFYTDGHPAALNFFVIGDAATSSNPLYGRGCAAGFLQAHLMAGICARSGNPFERALLFDTAMKRELRPYFDVMVKQDEAARRRAIASREGTHRPDLRARMTKFFFEDGVRPAARGDIKVMRALMRGFHMLEDPRIALQDPEILLRVSRFMLRGHARNAGLLGPAIGPKREEMLKQLSLPVR